MSGRPARMLVGAALAATLAVSLTACGSSDGDASDSGATGVRVTSIKAFGTFPLQVAVDQGFFDKNGLDVTFTPGTDITTFAPALGRQFDVALSTPVDFLTAASRGIEIKGFSGIQLTTEGNSNTTLVTKDPSIKDAADLEGKSVGVPSLAGTSYVALEYLLEEAGLSAGDVNFVATPFPTMGDQLDAGRLDAAISTIPFVSGLLAKGYVAAFDPVLEATKQTTSQSAFLSTSNAFAESNPEALDAFRTSIGQAIEWIGANEPAARAALADWLALPVDVANAAQLPTYGTDLTADQLEPFVDIVKTAAGVENVPDISTLIVSEQP